MLKFFLFTFIFLQVPRNSLQSDSERGYSCRNNNLQCYRGRQLYIPRENKVTYHPVFLKENNHCKTALNRIFEGKIFRVRCLTNEILLIFKLLNFVYFRVVYCKFSGLFNTYPLWTCDFQRFSKEQRLRMDRLTSYPI